MFFCAFVAASCFTLTADTPGPRLGGAFVQLDRGNKNWTREAWGTELVRMRAAQIGIVIVQYLEARTSDQPTTSEEYVPEGPGDPDPLMAILDNADCQGMKVFVGLRYDARLLDSEFLNAPGKLRRALADELARNTELVARLTERYQLATRASFAGWYLPVEVANFKEDYPGEKRGWVSQLSEFTKNLVKVCQAKVKTDVAVSPYFNGKKQQGVLPEWLVGPELMGKNYQRLLQGTGLSIVMLQDGVGVGKIPAAEVDGYVKEYLLAIQKACTEASPPEEPKIRFWLNVESICADINRLRAQMALGVGRAEKIVTFDFPHHLGQNPLYDAYLEYLAGEGAPRRRAESRSDNARASAPGGLEAEVEAAVRSHMEKYGIPGVSIAVVRDGEPLLVKGYGFANVELGVCAEPSTIYELASISKTFIATAVMMLAKNDRLRLDDPLSKYIQEIPPDWQRVRVHHLLTHTSGIKEYLTIPGFSLREDYSARSLIDLVARQPLDFEPGDEFSYSNTGFCLLGMIIERASGRSFGSFLEERIFEPLAMRSTRVNDPREIIARRASGYTGRFGRKANAEFVSPSQLAFADTALVSTVEDLVRWEASLCKKDGEPGSLLPQAWRATMWRPRFVKGHRPTNYGYGWYVIDYAQDVVLIAHSGLIQGFSSDFSRFVSKASVLTVIVLTNRELPEGAAFALSEQIASISQPGFRRSTKAVAPRRDPRQSLLLR